jgi:membrane protein DedA with SNARE-associated domain
MEGFLEYLDSLPNSLIYLLLGGSAFVENVFPPIPGDTITAYGAFLVGTGRLSFFGVYISTTIGSLLGFMSLFWVGLYLGRRFFIEKDYRFIKAEDIIRAEEWYRRYGYLLIGLNRFLPGVRSAISVAAGISNLRVIPVGFLAFVSCAVWNLVWILLGYALGSNWTLFRVRMSYLIVKYHTLLLILFALFLIIFLIRKKIGKWASAASNSNPRDT